MFLNKTDLRHFFREKFILERTVLRCLTFWLIWLIFRLHNFLLCHTDTNILQWKFSFFQYMNKSVSYFQINITVNSGVIYSFLYFTNRNNLPLKWIIIGLTHFNSRKNTKMCILKWFQECAFLYNLKRILFIFFKFVFKMCIFKRMDFTGTCIVT